MGGPYGFYIGGGLAKRSSEIWACLIAQERSPRSVLPTWRVLGASASSRSDFIVLMRAFNIMADLAFQALDAAQITLPVT